MLQATWLNEKEEDRDKERCLVPSVNSWIDFMSWSPQVRLRWNECFHRCEKKTVIESTQVWLRQGDVPSALHHLRSFQRSKTRPPWLLWLPNVNLKMPRSHFSFVARPAIILRENSTNELNANQVLALVVGL